MFRVRLANNVRRGLNYNVWRRWRGSTRESFLTGTSGVYVEQMHEAWKADPNSVHAVSELIQLNILLNNIVVVECFLLECFTWSNSRRSLSVSAHYSP